MESTKIYLFRLLAPFWFAFFALLIFLGIVIWVIKPDRDDDYDLQYMFTTVVVMIIGYFYAFRYSNKKTKKAKTRRGLNEKLLTYRTGMLVRWLILTLVALYSIFAFIMTREYLFVCATLFSLGVMFVGRSSSKILSEQLELTAKEKSVLKVPDAAI